MNIPLSIKIGLAKKGMTQAQVAKAVGRCNASISNLCTGKTKATQETIMALASAFGVPASEFIKWGE